MGDLDAIMVGATSNHGWRCHLSLTSATRLPEIPLISAAGCTCKALFAQDSSVDLNPCHHWLESRSMNRFFQRESESEVTGLFACRIVADPKRAINIMDGGFGYRIISLVV